LRQTDYISQILNIKLNSGFYLTTLVYAFVLLSLSITSKTIFDVSSILQPKHLINTSKYLTINKKISVLNTLGKSSSISFDEIKKIEKENFIDNITPIISTNYKLKASGDAVPFTTDLFLVGMESNFLDSMPQEFQWSENQKTVPIIVSEQLWTLYNFGFAKSQHLPQISKNTISNYTFTLKAHYKNGRHESYNAKIVGFSSRINSLLAPLEFINYSNNRYAQDTEPSIGTCMIKTQNFENVDLNIFLNKYNLETTKSSNLSSNIGLIAYSVLSILLLLTILVLLLVVKTIQQTFKIKILSKRPELNILSLIGYSQKDIVSLIRKYIILNAVGAFVTCSILLSVIHESTLNIMADNEIYLDKVSIYKSMAITSVILVMIILFQSYFTKKMLIDLKY
tara:strand:+ start:1191 stop:2378 length:1188 start_codon:yes stop_codon:yes gene_type:complete